MTPKKAGGVGCLIIDELISGENDLSGFSFDWAVKRGQAGLELFPLVWRGGDLLGAAQAQLYAAREACDAIAVLARGTGCGLALALAEQLPVDRLVLIEPKLPRMRWWRRRAGTGEDAGRRAQLRRLWGFARRNLSLCVSDALLIEGQGASFGARLCAQGLSAHCCVRRLSIRGENGSILFTNCENEVKGCVEVFLRAGELPKKLAQNREMCIIYG